MNSTIGGWTEETRGLCPTCLRTVPARLFEEEGRIWIRQECPKHGASRSLLASDAAEYLRLRTFVPPRAGGCCGGEEDCGTAGPPTCVLLLEITHACNLRCPTCYADARGHDFLSVEDCSRRLDQFFQDQSHLDVLMISGGEPTIHKELGTILDRALAYPVERILVNTNGLRLAEDDRLLELLQGHRSRVELYFSFASFRPEVHERLYGRDLREQKLRALDRAEEAGILVTLVPTVERGVNEDEIGALYRFALSRENINGLTYQPVMDTGRYENQYAPEQRITMTDVLRELEVQTSGDLRTTDFVGLPCSHPDCCALTYGFLDARRTTITPLPRHLEISRYLDLFSDRIGFSGLLSGAARRVWSDMVNLRAGSTLRDLSALFAEAGVRQLIPLLRSPEKLGKRIFRVVVKPFMDAHTYDLKRIEQCCTKILNDEGEPVSFCEYNVFHRGRKPQTAFVPLVG